MSEDATSVPTPLSPLAALKQQRLEWLAKKADEAATAPVADGYTRLTFDEIDRNFRALEALSQRRLTDGAPEKNVRILIRRYYQEAHAFFLDLRHLIVTNHPVPTNWEDDHTIPIVIAERRQQLFEELRRDTYDIPTVPKHLLLDEADMPVSSIKGELGHQNRFGVADIKIKLGYLYVEPDDEEKKTK